MIIWSYDRRIIWSYDHMIIWSYEHMIIWSYDHMIIWSDDMIIWSYLHMIIWSYDHMTIWSYDHMIIWSYGHMIIWSYDHMIISSYDHTIIWAYDHMIISSCDRAKIQKHFGFQGRKMKCWGSSETRFGQVSGQSEPSSGGKRTFKVCKHFENIFIEKWNVGDRLKRVLAKFEADRSQVWGVNGRSKFVGDGVGPFSILYRV